VDPDQAIRELAAIVGVSNVLSSRAERTVYGYDASVFRGTELLAVVLPETAQQISRLVTWCQRHQVPYLARGTGTGISGAAIPTHGGLVIEMARMNRVLDIDLENGVAVVEPGVINQDLNSFCWSTATPILTSRTRAARWSRPLAAMSRRMPAACTA
jgi:glycolate oxidase